MTSPDVCWFREGEPVLPSAGAQLLRPRPGLHQLLLHQVDHSQGGNFTLAVVNSSGELWHNFRVEVTGVNDH